MSRFASRGHFASYNGTAPIDASSGDNIRHRLSRKGNRRLNRVLHIAALAQIRHNSEGRDYYQRKLAQGKTPKEATRALKRRLSDLVWRQMTTDTTKTTPNDTTPDGPGRTPGGDSEIQRGRLNPEIDTSDKSQPEPATPSLNHPTLPAPLDKGVPGATVRTHHPATTPSS
ncbi:transposase [Actinoplanes sp. NPDC089786]|uniref:transposase n=1 Tax=Actinoplanes sp. NPDC089786 TaxID=3155185 RepID=UPI0034452AA6